MKLLFGLEILLVMAATAAADDANAENDAYAGDDADGGYNAYAGDNAYAQTDDAYPNANTTANSWGSWFGDHEPTHQSWGAWFGSNSINLRDRTFYRSGFVNPALKNPLYHQSAQSVLDNLGNFKALYVKYENCAFAPFGLQYENEDGRGGEGEDGNTGFYNGEQVLGCGADGGDDYWYMGRTPCFRAQAAFSLYGIPKGHLDISLSGSKCHKATYINSFFTTMGPEAFVAPLGVDTTYGNSYCTVYTPTVGNETYGYRDDDSYDDGPGHVTKYYFADYKSSGMGCKRHRFVQNTYGGAFCDGNDYKKTTDTLSSFNKDLGNLDCVQIYDSSSGYYYEEEEYEDEGHQEWEAVDFTALGNSVEILKYSKSCNIHQYPDSCPDPHGLLHKYSANLHSALSNYDLFKRPGEVVLNVFTGLFFFATALLVFSILRKRHRLSSKPPKKSMKSEKTQELKPPPPSTADEFSVVSSTVASSTHSGKKEEVNPNNTKAGIFRWFK